MNNQQVTLLKLVGTVIGFLLIVLSSAHLSGPLFSGPHRELWQLMFGLTAGAVYNGVIIFLHLGDNGASKD